MIIKATITSLSSASVSPKSHSTLNMLGAVLSPAMHLEGDYGALKSFMASVGKARPTLE